jgi:hypothetical protein
MPADFPHPSENVMRLVQFLACGALLAAGSVFAASPSGYEAAVQKSYVATNGVVRIAIVPFACPESIECEDLAKRLGKVLSARAKLKVTEVERTSRVMATSGIDKLDTESGYILAEGLKVDAFAVIDIQAEEIDTADEKVKHVKLNLRLVTKQGAPLLMASGEANASGMFSSLNGVAEKTLDLVLEQSIPEE